MVDKIRELMEQIVVGLAILISLTFIVACYWALIKIIWWALFEI